MKYVRAISSLLVATVILLQACTTVDLYEKSTSIPGHAWKSDFKPTFRFTIRDTSSLYQAYLVLRHSDRYNFSNIYVNLYVKGPGSDSAAKIQKDLVLASGERWLGGGMDDVFEHRIKLGDIQTLRAGDYQFTLEQIMREDPLREVLDVGIRVEKK